MTLHYRLNTPTVMSENIEGEIIAINLDSGCYHSLRGGAALVWEGLTAGYSLDAIMLYGDAPEASSRPALTAFVSELCSLDLLLPTDQPDEKSGDAVAGRWAPGDLRVESFRDMQELLLLDPVHDVSVEAGWPVRK